VAKTSRTLDDASNGVEVTP